MLEKDRIQEIQIKSGHLKSIYKDEKLFNSVQRCFRNPSLINFWNPETGLDYVQGATGTQQLRIRLRLIHSPPGRNQSSGYPHTWPQIVIAPTRPKHDRVGYCQEGGGRGQRQFHFQNHCYKAEAILAVPIHLILRSESDYSKVS